MDKKIHEDFLQLFQKTPTGYYKTKLPWKEDHIPLPTNKSLSVAQLSSTGRTLERTEKLQKYHQIMQEQGPMESWSSNHSSKGGGRTLHPLQTVIRGNALIKS